MAVEKQADEAARKIIYVYPHDQGTYDPSNSRNLRYNDKFIEHTNVGMYAKMLAAVLHKIIDSSRQNVLQTQQRSLHAC